MVKAEVVLFVHLHCQHIVSDCMRSTSVYPRPSLAITRVEGVGKSGITQVCIFCRYGSAVSLTRNVVGIKHDDLVGKTCHFEVLLGSEVELVHLPFSSVDIPEVLPSYGESYMIPTELLEGFVGASLLSEGPHRVID